MDEVMVSVIVPMRNAELYVEDCVRGVMQQRGHVGLNRIELCVHDDASTDNSMQELLTALEKYRAVQLLARVVISRSCNNINNSNNGNCCFDSNSNTNHPCTYAEATATTSPVGCGAARNKAIARSTGDVLVFCDADDVMRSDRVSVLTVLALRNRTALIGSNFARVPTGSTTRYEAFHHSLDTSNMLTFAFRDMPIAMPTIACHRSVLKRVGGFEENNRFAPNNPVAEDLELLYNHLAAGGKLIKTPHTLVEYRHHEQATSLSLSRRYLLLVRVAGFERVVLPHWESFSIWGAGRDGKQVFQALREENKRKVRAFLDIDERKIARGTLHGVRVLHFVHAQPPVAACVALDRTNGDFERNLQRVGSLVPGQNLFFLV